jgi:multiple sugar transport system substrate-binding protein
MKIAYPKRSVGRPVALRLTRRGYLQALGVLSGGFPLSGCLARRTSEERGALSQELRGRARLWLGGAPLEAYAQQFALWREQAPAVELELEQKQVFDIREAEALIAAIVAGDPPAVVYWNRPVTGSAAVKGIILPLDEFVKRDRFDLNRFYQGPLQECYGPLDRKLYALLFDVDNRLLYWSKPAFRDSGLDPEQPPQDWTDFAQMARRMTLRSSTGDLEKLGFNPSFGTELLYQWALANGGGDYLSADGRRVTLNAPKHVEALEFLVELTQALGGTERVSAFLSRFSGGGMNAALAAFGAGKLGMQISTNVALPSYLQYMPSGDFGAAAPPPRQRGMPPVTWAGGWGWAVPTGVPQPDLAWRLLAFLVSEEGVAARVAAEAALSAQAGRPFFFGRFTGQPRLDETLLARFPPPSIVAPLVQLGLRLMPQARGRPVSPLIAELWQAQKDATAAAIQGTMTARAALDDATRRVQAQLDQFWSDYEKSKR